MKKHQYLIVSLVFLLVVSLMGCSGDNMMNPQREDISSADMSVLEAPDGTGTGFSRYGIGLDGAMSADGSDSNFYFEPESSQSDSTGFPGS